MKARKVCSRNPQPKALNVPQGSVCIEHLPPLLPKLSHYMCDQETHTVPHNAHILNSPLSAKHALCKLQDVARKSLAFKGASQPHQVPLLLLSELQYRGSCLLSWKLESLKMNGHSSEGQKVTCAKFLLSKIEVFYSLLCLKGKGHCSHPKSLVVYDAGHLL